MSTTTPSATPRAPPTPPPPPPPKLPKVIAGSQQQWFARSSTVAGWAGGVWNIVLAGVEGNVPPAQCGNFGGATPFTIVNKVPLTAEKPYITIDSSGK